MTLSSELVGALKSFNERDPLARAGMFPITDGTGFLNRVMLPTNQPEVAGSSEETPRNLAEEASDSIQNAKLDPYVFSPPGMDLS
jgi:hypothetical protein